MASTDPLEPVLDGREEDVVRVAVVTADGKRVEDVDLPVVRHALEAVGLEADVRSWDSDQAWGTYDLVLLRSTWDYSWRHEEFLAWTRAVSRVTRLANPHDVVVWSSDKHYLGDLALAGVPVVPTTYVRPGDDAPVLLPDGEVVVKPTVAAGARGAARHAGTADGHDRARAHVRELQAQARTAMVQPYLAAVDRDGERALVFLGGAFSHAVRKGALLAVDGGVDDRRDPHPDLVAHDPSEQELAVARQALAAVPTGASALLYARVDLVEDDDGLPTVLELELVEPNLFLGHGDGAADRLAEAVLDLLHDGSRV